MRIAMGVEYDGSELLGFQWQSQGPTVQSELERVLGQIGDQPITVHGSGRTDSGVHAIGQVIHFDCQKERSARAWVLGANSNLLPSVAVLWAKPVSEEFHCRFAATGRRYRYRILNRWIRPSLRRQWLAHVREPLNAAAMHDAAQALVGEHDFSSFRALSCGARHPVRRLHRVDVTRQQDQIDVVVAGNAFLHHMVRNIVGTLIAIGRGDQPVQWMQQVLDARDRTAAGATAKAEGLSLEAVDYPAHWQIPATPMHGKEDVVETKNP